MHYAIKDRTRCYEIEIDKDKNKLKKIIDMFEKEDIKNNDYVKDYYYIEKVYDYNDIRIINDQILHNIYNEYNDFRICDVNTYSAYDDNELFSRILLVDKQHLIMLLSLSIIIDNELKITNFEVINKDYML